MRFYEIKITDPNDATQIWVPTSTGALVKTRNTNVPLQGSVSTEIPTGMSIVGVNASRTSGSAYTFTSHPKGKLQPPDPGALNLEIDLPVSMFHTPHGGGTFRLHGVGLRMIGQSANLNGQNVVLSAGMGKGLPLAKPSQAGIIYQGQIYQCWGNWVGTEQTLDFTVFSGDLTPSGGVSFTWAPGQSLSDSITASLAQAFPSYVPKVNVADLQVPWGLPIYDNAQSLMDFARMLHDVTELPGKMRFGDSYPGVGITTDGENIFVFDWTVPGSQNTVALAFEDLIGQPTWLGPFTISFQTVLRADIDVGDFVTFPTGIFSPYAQISAASANFAGGIGLPAQSKTAFQGKFVINEMHHYGNFRQSDASAWNTTFVASVIGSSSPSVSLLSATAAL